MPFTATASFADDIATVNRISSGLPAAKQSMLRSIGGMLLARQNEHFGQLSRTGSSNGVTWPAMDPDTLAKRKALQRRGLLANVDPSQLGVLTGRLAGSFRYRVGEDSVRLVNVDPAANYFAGRRPLYPRTIPAPWLASAESIAQRKLDQLSNPT